MPIAGTNINITIHSRGCWLCVTCVVQYLKWLCALAVLRANGIIRILHIVFQCTVLGIRFYCVVSHIIKFEPRVYGRRTLGYLFFSLSQVKPSQITRRFLHREWNLSFFYTSRVEFCVYTFCSGASRGENIPFTHWAWSFEKILGITASKKEKGRGEIEREAGIAKNNCFCLWIEFVCWRRQRAPHFTFSFVVLCCCCFLRHHRYWFVLLL